MNISKRMLMNARLVPAGRVVADIGCDHAKLSVYLIESHIATKVIAMDIGEGPLRKAAENIQAAGYGDRIDIRLSDGADKLKTDASGKAEADVAVIAGMGGMLALDIVRKDADKFRSMECFIIQAQSNQDVLRRSLYELGFRIIDEEMVYEDGKFYTSMKLTDMSHCDAPDRLGPAEALYGPVMISKRGDVFERFLLHEKEVCNRIMESIRDKDDPDYEKVKYKAEIIAKLTGEA